MGGGGSQASAGEALAAKSLKVISLTEKGPPGVFAGLENWGSM